jgi:mono/diheme cytochrome c family protein
MNTRKHWIAPAIFAGLVVSLSVTLLTIGARSPYTHLNLSAGVNRDYNRTNQTIVGPAQPIQAAGGVTRNGDLVQTGAQLFMNLDCASCHGLKGQGGVFAPVIVGTDASTLAKKTSQGPGGMPAFAGLSDQDFNALAAYLKSVASPAGGK